VSPVPADVRDAARVRLHTVAERVLAAARWTWAGRIGLGVDQRGIIAPDVSGPGGISGLRTDGSDLVVVRDGSEERHRMSTLGELFEAVGTPLRPPESYTLLSDGDPDASVEVDEAAALELSGWLDLGRRALGAFVVEVADDGPSPPTLWPEHFDLAVTACGVNYGVSPGDGPGPGDPGPYAYVGPHRPPEVGSDDDFWNRPYGRWVDAGSIDGVEGLLACFRDGRARHRERLADV
jgi:hypothetical protein